MAAKTAKTIKYMMIDLAGILEFQPGFSTGFLLLVIVWCYKAIRAYVTETRQEYVSRLNEVSLELEREKTKNLELELKIKFMEYKDFHDKDGD